MAGSPALEGELPASHSTLKQAKGKAMQNVPQTPTSRNPVAFFASFDGQHGQIPPDSYENASAACFHAVGCRPRLHGRF